MVATPALMVTGADRRAARDLGAHAVGDAERVLAGDSRGAAARTRRRRDGRPRRSPWCRRRSRRRPRVSTASPVRCPKLSLICLKWSTSNTTRLSGAPRRCDACRLPLERLVEQAPVGDTGERVARREPLDLDQQVRVAQRERGVHRRLRERLHGDGRDAGRRRRRPTPPPPRRASRPRPRPVPRARSTRRAARCRAGRRRACARAWAPTSPSTPTPPAPAGRAA